MKLRGWLLLVLVISPWMVWKLSSPKVATLQIKGVEPVLANKLVKMCEPLKGRGLFAIRREEVENLFSGTPFQLKSLEKRLPSTFIITLHPRQAIFFWENQGWDAQGLPAEVEPSNPPPIAIQGNPPKTFLKHLGELYTSKALPLKRGTRIIYHSPYLIEWQIPGFFTLRLREKQVIQDTFWFSLLTMAGEGQLDLRIPSRWAFQRQEGG